MSLLSVNKSRNSYQETAKLNKCDECTSESWMTGKCRWHKQL